MQLPSTPLLPVVGQVQPGENCCYLKCVVMRIGCKCQWHMCHKHCCMVGGCTANGHTVAGLSALPIPSPSTPDIEPALCPVDAQSLISSSSLSHIDPTLSPSSSTPLSISSETLGSSFSLLNIDPALCPFPSASLLSGSQTSVSSFLLLNINSTLCPASASSAAGVQMADPSIKPHHISQLCPIFADHIASVHERVEKKCQHDQQISLEKRWMHKHVLAFSFLKVRLFAYSSAYSFCLLTMLIE